MKVWLGHGCPGCAVGSLRPPRGAPLPLTTAAHRRHVTCFMWLLQEFHPDSGNEYDTTDFCALLNEIYEVRGGADRQAAGRPVPQGWLVQVVPTALHVPVLPRRRLGTHQQADGDLWHIMLVQSAALVCCVPHDTPPPLPLLPLTLPLCPGVVGPRRARHV
jgi:hypothetical protein